MFSIKSAAAAAFFIATSAFAQADTLPMPTGDVILTLSGAVSQETRDGVVTLDLAMLQDMETVTFSTSTIWIEGEVTFTGVPLHAILQYAGVSGDQISAVALNDYKVDMPVDEITPSAPIVAFHLNGQPMSARDKGPLWIVYPYDNDAKYRSEVAYSRSVWQLDRIISSN